MDPVLKQSRRKVALVVTIGATVLCSLGLGLCIDIGQHLTDTRIPTDVPSSTSCTMNPADARGSITIGNDVWFVGEASVARFDSSVRSWKCWDLASPLGKELKDGDEVASVRPGLRTPLLLTKLGRLGRIELGTDQVSGTPTAQVTWLTAAGIAVGQSEDLDESQADRSPWILDASGKLAIVAHREKTWSYQVETGEWSALATPRFTKRSSITQVATDGSLLWFATVDGVWRTKVGESCQHVSRITPGMNFTGLFAYPGFVVAKVDDSTCSGRLYRIDEQSTITTLHDPCDSPPAEEVIDLVASDRALHVLTSAGRQTYDLASGVWSEMSPLAGSVPTSARLVTGQKRIAVASLDTEGVTLQGGNWDRWWGSVDGDLFAKDNAVAWFGSVGKAMPQTWWATLDDWRPTLLTAASRSAPPSDERQAVMMDDLLCYTTRSDAGHGVSCAHAFGSRVNEICAEDGACAWPASGQLLADHTGRHLLYRSESTLYRVPMRDIDGKQLHRVAEHLPDGRLAGGGDAAAALILSDDSTLRAVYENRSAAALIQPQVAERLPDDAMAKLRSVVGRGGCLWFEFRDYGVYKYCDDRHRIEPVRIGSSRAEHLASEGDTLWFIAADGWIGRSAADERDVVESVVQVPGNQQNSVLLTHANALWLAGNSSSRVIEIRADAKIVEHPWTRSGDAQLEVAGTALLWRATSGEVGLASDFSKSLITATQAMACAEQGPCFVLRDGNVYELQVQGDGIEQREYELPWFTRARELGVRMRGEHPTLAVEAKAPWASSKRCMYELSASNPRWDCGADDNVPPRVTFGPWSWQRDETKGAVVDLRLLDAPVRLNEGAFEHDRILEPKNLSPYAVPLPGRLWLHTGMGWLGYSWTNRGASKLSFEDLRALPAAATIAAVSDLDVSNAKASSRFIAAFGDSPSFDLQLTEDSLTSFVRVDSGAIRAHHQKVDPKALMSGHTLAMFDAGEAFLDADLSYRRDDHVVDLRGVLPPDSDALRPVGVDANGILLRTAQDTLVVRSPQRLCGWGCFRPAASDSVLGQRPPFELALQSPLSAGSKVRCSKRQGTGFECSQMDAKRSTTASNFLLPMDQLRDVLKRETSHHLYVTEAGKVVQLDASGQHGVSVDDVLPSSSARVPVGSDWTWTGPAPRLVLRGTQQKDRHTSLVFDSNADGPLVMRFAHQVVLDATERYAEDAACQGVSKPCLLVTVRNGVNADGSEDDRGAAKLLRGPLAQQLPSTPFGAWPVDGGLFADQGGLALSSGHRWMVLRDAGLSWRQAHLPTTSMGTTAQLVPVPGTKDLLLRDPQGNGQVFSAPQWKKLSEHTPAPDHGEPPVDKNSCRLRTLSESYSQELQPRAIQTIALLRFDNDKWLGQAYAIDARGYFAPVATATCERGKITSGVLALWSEKAPHAEKFDWQIFNTQLQRLEDGQTGLVAAGAWVARVIAPLTQWKVDPLVSLYSSGDVFGNSCGRVENVVWDGSSKVVSSTGCIRAAEFDRSTLHLATSRSTARSIAGLIAGVGSELQIPLDDLGSTDLLLTDSGTLVARSNHLLWLPHDTMVEHL